MKPTHQIKGGGRDVCAWQNDRKSPIPMWVVRNFHDLGGSGVLTHRNGEKVKVNDWIVCDVENRVAACVTDAEFKLVFTELKPLPSHSAANAS